MPKRGRAGDSASQNKRQKTGKAKGKKAAEESPAVTSDGTPDPTPVTPPEGLRGQSGRKGLPGRTVVPTEGGTVDETTVGAENLPLAESGAISSPELPLSRTGPQIKLEETDIDQLASGRPVDSEEFSSDNQPVRERPAIAEERHRVIVFEVVSSSEPSERAAIVLTGVKNIFQKQLPKMPKEYIARLVYDRNHWSMAIVKNKLQVVGAITYRPFQQRGFAEIVFCAITGTEQVKGYGQHLMNHLKDHVREVYPTIDHFLTYADNYAVGYFKKQGFTKEITLDRSIWAGYIKDYEGGTIMQCTMLPAQVVYLQARSMLARQKEAILAKIRQFSRSHIVHKGTSVFPRGVTKVDPKNVPGLRDIGWTPTMDELTRRPSRPAQWNVMQRLLTDMQNQPAAWAFARPVNKDEVAEYYNVIKNPMDLETMEAKLEANMYPDLDTFLADANLIFENCYRFNAAGSNYSKNAMVIFSI